MDYHFIWFVLLGVLLAGYAILDGFDLGVGILHLLARTDQQRRLSMNSIGPIWDGNEVWLVTFGGALFAAFPEAYATDLFGILHGVYVAAVLPNFSRREPGVSQQNPIRRLTEDVGLSVLCFEPS